MTTASDKECLFVSDEKIGDALYNAIEEIGLAMVHSINNEAISEQIFLKALQLAEDSCRLAVNMYEEQLLTNHGTTKPFPQEK